MVGRGCKREGGGRASRVRIFPDLVIVVARSAVDRVGMVRAHQSGPDIRGIV